MSNTLKFGAGKWATGTDTVLAYNDENNNFKPLPFDFTRASTATVVNKLGLIEDVASGTPRIDFLGNTKGALLLEPQRTNACTYSESLTSWLSERVSVTANATSSPSGHTNSDKIVSDATADTTHQVYIGPFTNTAGNVVLSGYFKKGEYDWLHFGQGAAASKAWFNVNTGQVGTLSSLVVSTSITDAGNGWFRCVSLLNVATTTNYVEFGLATADGSRTISGTPPEGGLYGWGIQMEDASSYATSYIPTYGTAVTRVADACYKTGISSLIGQTEGVMFMEVDLTHNNLSGANEYLMQLHYDGSNRILMFRNATNDLECYFLNAAVPFFSNLTTVANGRHKLAFAYKSGDSAFYIDGVQAYTNTATFSAFSSLADLHIGANGTAQTEPGKYSYNQATLYNTRLTNAELATLTTL